MAAYGRGLATYTPNVIYHQVPSHCGGTTHISEQRVFVDHFSSRLVRLLTPLAAIYGHLSTISHLVPSVFQHRRAFVDHLSSHPVCLPTSTGNCRPSLISSRPSSDVDVHLSTISLISSRPSSGTTGSHRWVFANYLSSRSVRLPAPPAAIHYSERKQRRRISSTNSQSLSRLPDLSLCVTNSRRRLWGGRRYLVEHPIK